MNINYKRNAPLGDQDDSYVGGFGQKRAKNENDENLSDSDNDNNDNNQKKKLKSVHLEEAKPSSDGGFNNHNVDNKFKRMLEKQGYKEGKGLGKNEQGIVKPIEESNQKGKRGIGFEKNKVDKVEQWDFSQEEISAKECPEWLFNNQSVPDMEKLSSWIKRGKKKLTLDDEDNFCSTEILKEVLNCKSVFDNLENRELIQARTRSNPYETIGCVFFQNRAAMKMANIDSVFNNMFTDPKDSCGRSKIEENEPLYFVDICAGPGGFSEYVLWRKKNKSKGFGMTLRGENDFRLDDFVAGAPEYFETYYGVDGVEGDGDITNPENLTEFAKFVLSSTNEQGVHFVMADGGFSVEGNENIQEILSKQLYLCQFLCAISVLRTGGNFVCKLFDLFTPFSCGLVYLLYLCFDRICIHKPVTSRPANSERYIICENMKDCKSIIQSYFFKINEELWAYCKNGVTDNDIKSIVPMDVIKSDIEFFRYFKNSNEKLGKIQIINLKKIKAFASNQNLFDQRQENIREDCLKEWNVPDNSRVGGFNKNKFKRKSNQNPNYPTSVSPDDVFNKLNKELKDSILKLDILSIYSTNKLRELETKNLKENFKNCSIYDFRCILACGELVLLVGCGRSNVYEYNLNGNQGNKWKKLADWKIELPVNTIVLAEKVQEYRGVDKGQINLLTIHVIDALFLNGINLLVQNDKVVSFTDRIKNIKILEAMINKKSRHELNTIRVKDLIRFESLDDSLFQRLSYKKHKKSNPALKLGIHVPYNNPSDFYVYPTGLYLFKFVNFPWSVLISKRDHRKYFFNYTTGKSTYDAPSDPSFCSSPKVYWEDGYIWKWTIETGLEENDLEDYNESNQSPKFVTKQYILNFISSKLK